jgi:hypothetical protein
MTYRPDQCIIVRNIGPAIIKEVLADGTFFLFFASGKRGGGYEAWHFDRVISNKQFWSEWRKGRI